MSEGPMTGIAKFYPDGRVVTEVTNRGRHLCSESYRVSERVGEVLSDEELPDCTPTQHEVVGD